MTIDELNSSIFIFRSTSQFLFLLPLSYLHNPLFLIYIFSFTFLSIFLSSTIDSKTHTFLHFPSLHIFLRLSKFFFIFHVTLQAYVSSLFLSRTHMHTYFDPVCFLF